MNYFNWLRDPTYNGFAYFSFPSRTFEIVVTRSSNVSLFSPFEFSLFQVTDRSPKGTECVAIYHCKHKSFFDFLTTIPDLLSYLVSLIRPSTPSAIRYPTISKFN